MRVIWIVLDSFGVGSLPDAAAYGDAGANTLLHIAGHAQGFALPHLAALGLGKIQPAPGVPADVPVKGAWGKARERSAGKDTTAGHWEMAGVITPEKFPTFPNGFPRDFIDRFEKAVGRGTLGNKAASGTAILEELGAAHLRTGRLIVYTSADSVFQIAAHERVVPPGELYRICAVARAMLAGPLGVGRVIARPFAGEPGRFVRTAGRRDFSLAPAGTTVPDLVKAAGLPSVAIGKIHDIFAGRGFTESVHTQGNMDGVDRTLAMMGKYRAGLLFTNLVDYDMLYGHRRDTQGYADALMAFDRRLPEIEAALGPDDLLLLTADHGCDPTWSGTDHTREYVPLLFYGAAVRPDTALGIRQTFADAGATVADFLGAAPPAAGGSLLPLLTGTAGGEHTQGGASDAHI